MVKKNVFWAAVLWCLTGISPLQAQVPPSFADLAESLLPTVVNISTTHNPEDFNDSEEMPGIASTSPRVEDFFNPRQSGQLSLGSGFVIDKEGYIITNNHVIDKAREINVTFADNSQAQARLIGADSKLDLAMIKVDVNKELPAVKLGDSDRIRVGDWILAIGNPFGLGGSVTAGIVSAKSRDIEAGPYDNFIQTDASINQGSSGGPMFNLAGEAIGINTAIFSTNGGSMGIGFAVPVNLTKFVISELKSKGKVERGWLGIRIQPNSVDISSSLGQPGNRSGGVLVSAVSEGSSARAAGVEPGDIILTMDGKAVSDAKDFSRTVAETAPGAVVALEIWRNKAILNKKLEVQAMPEEPETSAAAKATPPAPAAEGLIKYLGLEVAEADAEVLNKFHLESGKPGVVIMRVLPGSDAEAKGLQAGNLITQIDKKDIFDINDVKTYVEEARLENHRPVLLLIHDNNIPHYAAVKLIRHE